MENAFLFIFQRVSSASPKTATSVALIFAHQRLFLQTIAVLVETRVASVNVVVTVDVVRQPGLPVRKLQIASVENAVNLEFVYPLRLRVDRVALILIVFKTKFAVAPEYASILLDHQTM